MLPGFPQPLKLDMSLGTEHWHPSIKSVYLVHYKLNWVTGIFTEYISGGGVRNHRFEILSGSIMKSDILYEKYYETCASDFRAIYEIREI